MARGRKPAPVALKLLKGERPTRINRSGPRLPEGTPEPPDDLSGEALAEWHRIARLVGATEQDGPHLDIYAGAYERWRAAHREIARQGILLTTGDGGAKANPATTTAKGAEDTMFRVLGELRRRADSRAGAAGPKDDLGDFLSRGPGKDA